MVGTKQTFNFLMARVNHSPVVKKKRAITLHSIILHNFKFERIAVLTFINKLIKLFRQLT